MSINSRDYWNTRFQTDWSENEGPAQTRFFAALAIDAMPEWFKTRVRASGLEICDWGCAEGEGAAMLAESLGVPVTGVDFSVEAIERAKAKFPELSFDVSDWLARKPEPAFDIVFSSNTLEHFRAPWSVFDRIASFARRYVVLMLPYREIDRHPEHFAGFTPESVPATRAGWVLVHSAIVDAARMEGSLWPGEQILAIYAQPSELETLGLPLSAVHIDAEGRPEVPETAPVATILDTKAIDDRLGVVHADLIRAISDDIVRMREQNGAMLASTAALQQERDAWEARAGRAEQLAQSIVEARDASDRRSEVVTSLVGAVTSLEARLSRAITEDIVRMQAAHADLLREAGELQGRVAELNRAVATLRDEAREAGSETERLRDLIAVHDIERERWLDAHTQAQAERERLLDAFAQTQAARARDLGELARLRDEERRLANVLSSTSWRVTKPLRFARRLLRNGFGTAERASLGGWVAHARWLPMPRRGREWLVQRLRAGADGQLDLLPSTLLEQGGMPTLAAAGQLEDVFVWAVIDWHFRTQRPQHLARAMAAKGHRVFYISNNFIDNATPGFSVESLDSDGRLFQVRLNLDRAPAIYFEMPGRDQVAALRASVAELLRWTATTAALSLIQHPYWSELVGVIPNVRVAYDCMDHHAGFADNAADVVEAERALLAKSDLVIVTSDWLQHEVAPMARATSLIRNAGEYSFFSERPANVFGDDAGRRIVGYYGAIAEWFDTELVRKVAEAMPDVLVLLVGNDTAGAAIALEDLPNVRFTGEVPYQQLPYWLYAFDVCLLPFRILPLTLATNPVKAYEYLAAGKPIVSVDLPEMRQFGELVAIARDDESFVAAVARELDGGGADMTAARRAFAAQQTWGHRAASLDDALASMHEPRVSVIVLTYNNLAFTQACLFSIEAYSGYRNIEIIVVDNMSADGSRDWLQSWVDEPSKAGHLRRLILNDANLGFSAGNNVGLRAATGDYLVILNNDTYVTPGWVRTLCAHLRRDPTIGLIGPVTNNIGNEARVDIHYADMVEMIRVAGDYTRAHPGATYPMRTAAFFCVAMPRTTYEMVGDMDEDFGVGFFEDDDYCRRVAAVGLRIVCAEDVFIHHHLSASFDALKAGAKQMLFERNKAIYEAKWGPWEPHVYRSTNGERA